MKRHIEQLHKISKKKTRQIIGLMSGTSLDGLDVAWCQFSGSGSGTKVELRGFETVPFDENFKNEIRRVFAKREIEFQHLVLLNVVVAEKHAAIIMDCLKKWNISPAEIDLVASHGQTVFHAPKILHGLENYPNATLQIGDGDHLAVRLGIPVLSDFRQKHLAFGGEGAPLALYGDYFLFSKRGENRVLLNIGGIANFTFLPADGDPEKAIATDTGPGNTLLDLAAQQYFGVPFDENSLLARAGRVDERLLDILKSDPFFKKPFPKTTGPELFGKKYLENAIAQLPKGQPNPHDLMATLSQFTADTIADAIEKFFNKIAPNQSANLPIPQSTNIYISGGGAHNPLILEILQSRFPKTKISKMEKLGIPGDAKEAVLFAVLGNETIAGNEKSGQRLGGLPIFSMGKISLPG